MQIEVHRSRLRKESCLRTAAKMATGLLMLAPWNTNAMRGGIPAHGLGPEWTLNQAGDVIVSCLGIKPPPLYNTKYAAWTESNVMKDLLDKLKAYAKSIKEKEQSPGDNPQDDCNHTNYILDIDKGLFATFNISSPADLYPPIELDLKYLRGVNHLYFFHCPDLEITLDASKWIQGRDRNGDEEECLFDLKTLVIDENTTLATYPHADSDVWETICRQLKEIGVIGTWFASRTEGTPPRVDEGGRPGTLRHLRIDCVDTLPGDFLYTRKDGAEDMVQDEGLGCVQLLTAHFAKVRYVGKNCLHGCFKLQNVYMPKLIAADYNFLDECLAIRHVSFPKLKVVGRNSFSGCKNLVSVHLPELLTDDLSGVVNGKYDDLRDLDDYYDDEITNDLEELKESITGHCHGVSFNNELANHGWIFNHCLALPRITLEKFRVSAEGFGRGCYQALNFVYLPNLVKAGNNFLELCDSLEVLLLPKVTEMGYRSIGYTRGVTSTQDLGSSTTSETTGIGSNPNGEDYQNNILKLVYFGQHVSLYGKDKDSSPGTAVEGWDGTQYRFIAPGGYEQGAIFSNAILMLSSKAKYVTMRQNSITAATAQGEKTGTNTDSTSGWWQQINSNPPVWGNAKWKQIISDIEMLGGSNLFQVQK